MNDVIYRCQVCNQEIKETDTICPGCKADSLGWLTFSAGDIQPMDDPTRAAIRQIAHEVLKSLIPGYTKTLEN